MSDDASKKRAALAEKLRAYWTPEKKLAASHAWTPEAKDRARRLTRDLWQQLTPAQRKRQLKGYRRVLARKKP